MTDTAASTPASPKKSWKKQLFWAIAIVLGALGIDHYTFHYVSGGVNVSVTVTDSTITSSVNVDTTLTLVSADTTKADTTK